MMKLIGFMVCAMKKKFRTFFKSAAVLFSELQCYTSGNTLSNITLNSLHKYNFVKSFAFQFNIRVLGNSYCFFL